MKRASRQSGFSLLEMIIVVAILLVVTAIVFGNVNSIRQRAQVQKGGVESLQDARGTMDLIVHDVHNAGFPNQKMYRAQLLAGMATTYLNGNLYYEDTRVAYGIVSVTDTTLLLEGDVNGDGVVEQVAYRLQPDPAFGTPNGQCPCVLQRNVMTKPTGSTAGTSYAANWDNLVGGIVNSGSSNYTLYGSSYDVQGNNKTLDNMFTAYKGTPVFTTVFDNAGRISGVLVNLDVIGITPDPQNGLYPFATLSATSRTYQPQ